MPCSILILCVQELETWLVVLFRQPLGVHPITNLVKKLLSLRFLVIDQLSRILLKRDRWDSANNVGENSESDQLSEHDEDRLIYSERNDVSKTNSGEGSHYLVEGGYIVCKKLIILIVVVKGHGEPTCGSLSNSNVYACTDVDYKKESEQQFEKFNEVIHVLFAYRFWKSRSNFW